MPVRPGVNIVARETPPPRSAPTDVGPAFMIGFTERGDTDDVVKPVKSMDDFVRLFGNRVSYGMLYDAAEIYFKEGGSKIFISRVKGAGYVKALLAIQEAATTCFTVVAESPGIWGNSLRVQIINPGAGGAGTFDVVISHATLGELERYSNLLNKAAFIAAAVTSNYITVTDGPNANDPTTLAATPLATGADDHAGANDASWQTALDLFTKDLGPGQVMAPGQSTLVRYTALLLHAQNMNRVALLDPPDTGTVATLVASAATARALTTARYGAYFAPWVVGPGVLTGTYRDFPPSPMVAGIMSRNDGAGLNPNEPAAGDNGDSRFAIRPKFTFLDADRTVSLNPGSVNAIINKFGAVRVYGYRSLVDPNTLPNYINFGHARLYMAVAAKADAIGENYLLKQIDGRRLLINQFGGELTSMLSIYHAAGALYGATPEEAFNVDVGPQVNTDTTIAAQELKAVLTLRPSEFAEIITIELVKVPITGAVA